MTLGLKVNVDPAQLMASKLAMIEMRRILNILD